MITQQEIDDLQVFFNSIEKMPEKLIIHKAVTCHNLSKSITNGLELLKDKTVTSIVANTRYHSLLEIKAALIEQGYAVG